MIVMIEAVRVLVTETVAVLGEVGEMIVAAVAMVAAPVSVAMAVAAAA